MSKLIEAIINVSLWYALSLSMKTSVAHLTVWLPLIIIVLRDFDVIPLLVYILFIVTLAGVTIYYDQGTGAVTGFLWNSRILRMWLLWFLTAMVIPFLFKRWLSWFVDFLIRIISHFALAFAWTTAVERYTRVHA
jgi:hypothetical protein